MNKYETVSQLVEDQLNLIKDQAKLITELQVTIGSLQGRIESLRERLAHYHSEEERAKTDPFNLVKEGLCKENEGHIE